MRGCRNAEIKESLELKRVYLTRKSVVKCEHDLQVEEGVLIENGQSRGG